MGSIEQTDVDGYPAKRNTTCLVGNYHIEGFVSESGVANYLGIPYAEIPSRFRQARPIKSSEVKGTFDAKRYGPICPQNIDLPRKWREHLYHGVVHSDALPVSEYECLNLNVYAPSQRSEGLLPVFVWIHGGGFVVGDGGPEYDGNYIVEYASKLGQPFIYVAFNYRLGYFGFLHSQELKAEAGDAGEVRFANVGLHDQRLALQWVQQNICYFGGDGSNVTIAGESAGAWSVLAHLRSGVPICQRAMIMSAPSLAPGAAQTAQEAFDSLFAKASSTGVASDCQKLEFLRNLSVEKLLSLTPPSLILPTWDPEWFLHKDGLLPLDKVGDFPSWCDGITAGWTHDEIALFGIVHGWDHWSIDMVQAAVRLAIPDSSLADEVIETYGIMSKTQDAKSAVKALIAFASDATFGSLMESMGSHTHTSTPVSLYRFDQVDTFEQSPFLGYAYHALDNVFICRLPAVAGKQAPLELRLTADALTESVCKFVYGKQPWAPYSLSGQIKTFNGHQTGLIDWTGSAQWKALATTPARVDMLKKSARALMSITKEELLHQ
ncbi:uncharacterized protein PV07_01243 [Cladophialophora immunda]|uniref:Carboxylic ester hydrolase n=1 Tax=Cladophialophora immunda TaxID=569365 RepID=A0A0D2CX94_9EURO|nr:uncharacterized protein PV07_01243 [Cladophialophora immunda]KIW34465.1 hypothetical protein PV07_01243 [Cladophialophora immunda]